MPVQGRVLGVACVIAGVMGPGAGVAGAWTMQASSGVASVAASAGEVNSFDIEDLGGGVLIQDLAGNALTSAVPAGCVSASASEIDCDPGVLSAVSIDAGDGNDALTNGSVLARVTLAGGPGNDELAGGPAAEVLAGGPGNDTIQGAAGGDVLDGGEGADQLTGGDGGDQLAAGSGDDRVNGSDGDDAVDAGPGQDVVGGGAGSDQLGGGAGNDELSGDDGADSIAGGGGDDLLDGGRDADTLDGNDGADELSGGEGSDLLTAGAGDDHLAAGAGNDVLDGAAGSDTALGGDGNDQMHGGDGSDSLDGGAGDDGLSGGAGDDALVGGDGADILAGSDGIDEASYAAQAGPLTVVVGDGANDGLPGERDDVRADVERVLGGSGPDTLTGAAGGQRLDGGSGDDVLDGGTGADELIGAAGIDTVTYGARVAGVVAAAGQAGAGEPGEGDRIDVSVENLVGGAGADTLTGSSAADNVLAGGAGDDVLRVRDATSGADRAICGIGTDTADADASDVVALDCERLSVAGTQVRPPPPAALPRVFLGPKRLHARAPGTVRIPLQCASATPGACAGHVRLGKRSRGRSPALGRAQFRIAPGALDVVEVRLTPGTVRKVRAAGPRGIAVIARLALRARGGRWVVREVRVRIVRGAS